MKSTTTEEKQWEMFAPEESQLAFDFMKRKYKIRYKNAEVPKNLKTAITLIYAPCLVVSAMTLAFIGYMLEVGKIGTIAASVYVLASGLTLVALLVFGYLLWDLMSLETGWLFRLYGSGELNSSGFLRTKLALDFKVIMVRLGVVRVFGVREREECFLEVCNELIDQKTNYEMTLEGGGKRFLVDHGEFERGKCGNGKVKIENFPPMFEEKASWQLRVNLRGPFPDDFCREKDEKGTYKETPLFTEIEYAFEGKSKPSQIGAPIDFVMSRVAYKRPAEPHYGLVVRESWVTIFERERQPTRARESL